MCARRLACRLGVRASGRRRAERPGAGQGTGVHMIYRLTRRAFAQAALAAALSPLGEAWAQSYPTRPVRVILPFAAGGQADICARLVAERLTEKLGQRFVVENQPGPGGIVAARSVLSAAPDGYTLGLATNGTSISVALYNTLPFDPVKDFATISTFGYFDLVFATNSE